MAIIILSVVEHCFYVIDLGTAYIQHCCLPYNGQSTHGL